jgi:hypothetical protein
VVTLRPGLALVSIGTVGACALAVHTAVNLRLLRSPAPDAPPVTDDVYVLIPARDEVAHVGRTVRSVLAQTGVPRLRVVVLDDGSTDGTADVLDAVAAADDRVRVVHADDAPPEGWLGKPWACARLGQLAAAADGPSILVFVDADVVLRPHAVRAVAATLRENGFALVAPYPFQEAETWLERLVQPLVTWSWAATMPVRWAETSTRTSLSAANGQFIAVDADAYRDIDGHASVRGDVLEDIALMRAMKSAGRATSTVDGSQLASCRMYDGAGAVVDGYAKSLWAAFGGPVGSVAVNGLLLVTYLVPAIAAVAARDRRTRRLGALGYAAGVASRALVARRTGERILPDALVQPASIAAFCALNAVSWQRHLRGANRWKGRAVVTT